MSINVRFGKSGYYHPAFGRMGRGKSAGKVYVLPDAFAVPGALPSSAEIISDPDELEQVLEDEGQTKAIKPKLVDEVQLARLNGEGPLAKPQRSASSTAQRQPRTPAKG
jgi:hypothetical protein